VKAVLRRIAPKSLVGQILLAAAAALLLAQAVNLTLLLLAQREQRINTVSVSAASRLIEIQDRLAQGIPLDRPRDRRRARSANERPGLFRLGNRSVIIADEPRFPAGMTEWPTLAERVRAAVGESYGDTPLPFRTIRAARMPQDGQRERGASGAAAPRRGRLIAVAAQLADGRWVTIRARQQPAEARIGAILFGQTLVLFALLMLPLAWVARRVARPLTALSAATAAMRPGSEAAPVAESGPGDVRWVQCDAGPDHGHAERQRPHAGRNWP
jgi:hypothetical protein